MTCVRLYDLFFSQANLTQLANTTLDVLCAKYRSNPQRTSIFLYYFSNGGCFVHEKLMSKLTSANPRSGSATPTSIPTPASTPTPALTPTPTPTNLPLPIAGNIFDSSPVYLTVDSGAKAVSEGLKNPAAKKAAYWAGVVVVAVYSLLTLLCHLLGVTGLKTPRSFWESMRSDRLPALYIYSTSGHVTEPRYLTKLVAQRRERQGKDTIEEWLITGRNSPHVCHYIKNPEEYTRRLSKFINDRLL